MRLPAESRLLRSESEYMKFTSNSFIDLDSCQYCFKYLKTLYDCNIDFEDKIGLYRVYLYTGNGLVYFDFILENNFWASYITISGKKELVERNSQYFYNYGIIFLKTCFSDFSTDKEHQIYLLYRDINSCKSLDEVICSANKLTELESELTGLHNIEKRLLSKKLLYLKDELLITECLMVFENFITIKIPNDNEMYLRAS